MSAEKGTPRPLLLAALLIAAVFLVYRPAWHGGVLWDDENHITRPDLRPAEGLKQIWLDIGATQQYYPLLHSVFWLEHRLWGNEMFGYHALTILLHALSALLVAAILQRLNVPGALLAAAIFALHPVHVESVAWVSEQKNTLSGALYLSALLAYLRFDDGRRVRHYALALTFFVLALLSKTVTATLPAALLAILWWKRGRLDRRDILPLLPWVLLSAGSGLLTSWFERTHIGASGADFDFSLLQRSVIAGRAVVFYLGKLLWPGGLTFNYPRWEIPLNPGWQILYPLGVGFAVAGLWWLRSRSRAPLAAALFFGITLFPVLGFLNVFPFFYSFVADHFQYLASLGPITLFAAGLAGLSSRWRPRPWAPRATAVAVVAVLGILSWRQSRQYTDIETLYRETIARNPGSWLALNNLCNRLKHQGRFSEALPLCEEAVRLNPGWYLAKQNLGEVLNELGRRDEALPFLLEAVRLNPDDSGTHTTLCQSFAFLGRLPEAEEQCRQAVRRDPDSSENHNNLGVVLENQSRLAEALERYREAVHLDPGNRQAEINLRNALQRRDRVSQP